MRHCPPPILLLPGLGPPIAGPPGLLPLPTWSTVLVPAVHRHAAAAASAGLCLLCGPCGPQPASSVCHLFCYCGSTCLGIMMGLHLQHEVIRCSGCLGIHFVGSGSSWSKNCVQGTSCRTALRGTRDAGAHWLGSTRRSSQRCRRIGEGARSGPLEGRSPATVLTRCQLPHNQVAELAPEAGRPSASESCDGEGELHCWPPGRVGAPRAPLQHPGQQDGGTFRQKPKRSTDPAAARQPTPAATSLFLPRSACRPCVGWPGALLGACYHQPA